MAEVLDTTANQLWKSPAKKTVAVDDKASTDEDTAITIDVLSNDKNAIGVYNIFQVNKINDTAFTDIALADSLVAEDYTASVYTRPYTIDLHSGAKVTLEGGKVSYDPNGQFDHLNTGETQLDSFAYTAYGRYNVDRATVTVEIKGVDDPGAGNQPPVAVNDFAFVPTYPYPYPKPYPYPETYSVSSAEAEILAETDQSAADLWEGPIYTTLAIGEEGDPYELPVEIDVLANDWDPNPGDTLTIGTINGKEVAPGASVKLDSGATVTLTEKGTLLYDGPTLNWLLGTEDQLTVTESADATLVADLTLLPYPGPSLIDRFTYQAEDNHEALSNTATVTVYRDSLYYYDVLATDPVLDDMSPNVNDGSLLIA